MRRVTSAISGNLMFVPLADSCKAVHVKRREQDVELGCSTCSHDQHLIPDGSKDG